MVETKRGIYCYACSYFGFDDEDDVCPACRSSYTGEKRGIICPACGSPTPTDDPNYRQCLECEAPLPPVE